ncbi:MAG TPA: hypothetical protein VHU18_08885 [Rhizomicrobium sp.]|nr:hypothetical protein [Rhizomicrobium sp.]
MKKTLALGFVAAAALCSTSAMAAKDNFDRSDLGKKWVVTSGRLYINNNQLQGDSLSIGYDKKSASDTTVSATLILNGTDLEYGAVASGNIASGNNAFVKLQEANGDGAFEYGAFYTGNNGGGDYFQLNSPVSSPAQITLSFCGTVATLKIKSASGKQTYTYDYGTSFGGGGGLGTYGLISIDNYKSKPGGCTADRTATVIKHTSNGPKDPTLAK